MPNFKYITRQQDVDALLPILMSKPTWCLDVEATGLDFLTDKVVLVQIGNKEQQFVIDTRVAKIESLRPFFESETIKKLGFNLKYEYKMFRSNFGIELECLRDIYIAERLLLNGLVEQKRSPKGYFGLAQVLKRRLNIDIDKTLQTSFKNHQGEFTNEQLSYAAIDVEHLLPLGQKISKLLFYEGQSDTWVLECDALPAFGDMECDGLILDVSQWESNIREFTLVKEEIKRELDRFTAPFCEVNLWGEVVGFDYDSPKQLVNLFQRLGFKVKVRDPKSGIEVEQLITNTSKETQKKLMDSHVIKLLKKYREAQKRITSYGRQYIEAIRKETNRIHPEVDQIGTASGRPANRGDVSFLGIPRDNRFRNAVKAERDYLVETDDYNTCELRILAEFSLEPNLVEAFLKKEDVHCTVARDLYDVPVRKQGENSHLRAPGKSLNLGLTYGQGVGRLCDDLNSQGFPITYEKARDLIYKYRRKYPRATEFLRSAGELAVSQGWISNANGRRRHWRLPDPQDTDKFPLGRKDEKYQGIISQIRREGASHVISSVSADITKTAMIQLRKFKKHRVIRTQIINQIYDEIVTHTHQEDSPEFVLKKREIMVSSSEKWLKTVPMVVEGHVGNHWHKE